MFRIQKHQIKWVAMVFGMAALSPITSMGAQGFGLGFVIGQPTGISAKLNLSSINSVNMVLGYNVDHSDLHLHADYVWHNYGAIPVSVGKLPIYYGMGGLVEMSNDPLFGVRGVFGIEYQWADAPLDVFLELAPGAALFPNSDFIMGIGLGMRYFF